ncbi:hypothetical protein [Nocardia cyriacigeorgica]|uniref:hypothetical protein n=1 Tax=Nocardia cyriacigeorgica TaxID=135487 RepID=UPI002454B0BE|nr:hypothetical protein [Nocardia cyriacigeorgica]
MTITRLWVHPRGDRKTQLDLSKLDENGSDLLHLFHGFAVDVTAPELLKASTESFANPIDIQAVGRTVTLCVEVGRYGETGTITNVVTMTPVGAFTKDDATSVKTHGTMLLPIGSTSGLLFVERSANQSGVLRVLERFREKFDLAFPDLKLETEPVVESEAWLKRASLSRVSAYVTRKPTDIADTGDLNTTTSELGELAHTLRPPQGMKALPRRIYDRLRQGELTARQLLVFRDDEEPEDVEVTLEYNGQSKTFVLGQEKQPSISLLMSGSGEEAWPLEKVRKFALDQAKELFDRLGVEWRPSFATGTWTTEQLAARLVNALEQQT